MLRFSLTPPTYDLTTTDHDILYELRGSLTGSTGLNIPVSAGDMIGVLGYRGGINSYANLTTFTTSVLGAPILLERLGSQNSLVTSSVEGLDVFREASSSIGRVTLSVAPAGATVIPLPASGLLLIGAMGGLAFLRRRRTT